ncbi:MAG: hypothetical protein IT449_01650 [Phycisphaerales bacterium]|nr:hypothetical protein [Phycisphaerales bacterium]
MIKRQLAQPEDGDSFELAVGAGDLLITWKVLGHAMKVTDIARSQGAVLGKAMQPLSRGGKGLVLVLVLVTLQ